MKYFLLLSTFLLAFISTSNSNQKWGKTGHRVIGDVAAQYLNDDAAAAVDRILDGESMAIASTWMDEIRSDPKWDYTHDWHWVTIPDGKTYAETEKNPNGDVIWAIRKMIKELKNGDLSHAKEQQNLKMLIHLVGDVHQPLHVGTGKDQGGNRVDVRWFWDNSNLHRVWDSGMIDESKLSYTELSEAVDHVSQDEINKWQNNDVTEWAQESMKLRDEVYDLPKDHDINYEYMYDHWDIAQHRLLQAGIRLAGVLNDIYG